MDDAFLRKRLEQCVQLIQTIRIVPLATTGADSQPWCSPVFLAFDHGLCGYWASHPGSVHSQNIARSGRVMCTVFDSRHGHGGLFIEGHAERLSEHSDIEQAYATMDAKQRRDHLPDLGGVDQYVSEPQRLYRLTPGKLWVNYSEKDEAGRFLRDRRHELALADIKSALEASA